MARQINSSVWQDKKVLITGHTGFKGSWLALWLHSLGAQVSGFSLSPATTPNLYSLLDLDQKIQSFIGDIRNLDEISTVVEKVQPDIIFHLAAQPLVRQSYKNPVETYQINVLGTVNVLEAFRLSQSATALLNVTTDKVYENKEWIYPYRENDRLGGHDPYSNSKACSELVTEAYRKSFFSQTPNKLVASARAGNVIGGGDWSEDRLIPDLVRALDGNKQVEIRNPEATRPWQHVLEPLLGYILLGEELLSGNKRAAEGWNLGPDTKDIKTVAEVIASFSEALGEEIRISTKPDQSMHEAQLLALDATKAKTKLGWTPRLSTEEALDLTAQWYKAQRNGEDVKKISLEQIIKYSNN